MEKKLLIECDCGSWEELPIDEQRWHTQSFIWLEDYDYKCEVCNAIVTGEVQ